MSRVNFDKQYLLFVFGKYQFYVLLNLITCNLYLVMRFLKLLSFVNALLNYIPDVESALV